MTWWAWAIVAACCWLAAGFLIAVLFGRIIRRRDRAEQADVYVWSLGAWRELDRLERRGV